MDHWRQYFEVQLNEPHGLNIHHFQEWIRDSIVKNQMVGCENVRVCQEGPRAFEIEVTYRGAIPVLPNEFGPYVQIKDHFVQVVKSPARTTSLDGRTVMWEGSREQLGHIIYVWM